MFCVRDSFIVLCIGIGISTESKKSFIKHYTIGAGTESKHRNFGNIGHVRTICHSGFQSNLDQLRSQVKKNCIFLKAIFRPKEINNLPYMPPDPFNTVYASLFSKPGKARGCSTNTFVINSVSH